MVRNVLEFHPWVIGPAAQYITLLTIMSNKQSNKKLYSTPT